MAAKLWHEEVLLEQTSKQVQEKQWREHLEQQKRMNQKKVNASLAQPDNFFIIGWDLIIKEKRQSGYSRLTKFYYTFIKLIITLHCHQLLENKKLQESIAQEDALLKHTVAEVRWQEWSEKARQQAMLKV